MKILGVGSALPKTTVTNEDLAAFLDTTDEWIVSRTGIKSRQVLRDETLLSLGIEAGRAALERAGVEPSQIDFLICTTLMGDTVSPGLGCLLVGALGLSCAAVDVNGACAGFVYGLDMADAYIASGKAKKILIVSAEANTRICDWSDRSTAVLFGDGAGALVVGEGEGYLGSILTVQPNIDVLNYWPHAGNSPYAKDFQHAYQALYMMGQEVYKFAVSAVVRDLKNVCARTGIMVEQIDKFVLHQANLRIIEAARQRLKQPPEKFPHNIEHTGNTSSASVPILLDEMIKAGELREGMLLLISAFGAGLTTGTCLLRWG